MKVNVGDTIWFVREACKEGSVLKGTVEEVYEDHIVAWEDYLGECKVDYSHIYESQQDAIVGLYKGVVNV